MSGKDDSSLHERLSALLDGELPEAEARELRGQIEGDPELRREFESLRKTVDAIRGLDRVRAPIDLRERLRHRPRRSRPILRLLTGVAAGIAAAAALVIAVRFGLEPESPRDRFQEATGPEAAESAAVGDEKRRSQEKQAVPTRTEAVADAEPEGEVADAEEALGFDQRKSRGTRGVTAGADADAPSKEKLERDSRVQPGAPAQPTEKSARSAGELREAEEVRATLSTLVAEGGLVASKSERTRYLAELLELESKDLSSHFAALERRGRRGFAAPPSPASVKKSKAKSAAPPPAPVAAEALTAGRGEAMLMREILSRAFPTQRGSEGGAAGQPEVRLGAHAQDLFVDLALTPGELTQVHAWLDLLKDSRRAGSGPDSAGRAETRFESARDRSDVSARVEPTKGGKGPPKRAYRIRLIYPARPAPQPEAKAGGK